MNIGDRIKTLRMNRDLSQTELAEKIGVSKQTLYKYENSLITNIPSDKIELLARYLGSSPAVLMGWEPNTDIEEDNIWHPNYRMYNALLEDEDYCLLLEAAAGCTKAQIKMATNMLNEFKNPNT